MADFAIAYELSRFLSISWRILVPTRGHVVSFAHNLAGFLPSLLLNVWRLREAKDAGRLSVIRSDWTVGGWQQGGVNKEGGRLSVIRSDWTVGGWQQGGVNKEGGRLSVIRSDWTVGGWQQGGG